MVLLEGGGTFRWWGSVEESLVVGAVSLEGYWDPRESPCGPLLAGWHEVNMLLVLCTPDDMLRCQRPKATGPRDCGLKTLKP